MPGTWVSVVPGCDPCLRRRTPSIREPEHVRWSRVGESRARLPYPDLALTPQCGVFRAFQGWTSLSHTGPNEGTLRVYPYLKEMSAYLMLRPLFRSVQLPRAADEKADQQRAGIASGDRQRGVSAARQLDARYRDNPVPGGACGS